MTNTPSNPRPPRPCTMRPAPDNGADHTQAPRLTPPDDVRAALGVCRYRTPWRIISATARPTTPANIR